LQETNETKKEKMMEQIFKYPIEGGKFSLTLPAEATFLAAQMQNEQPYFWARVDSDTEKRERHFEVIATGQKFNPKGKIYLTTFQQGPFVWHLHEVIDED
jgi:hypothetical protein